MTLTASRRPDLQLLPDQSPFSRLRLSLTLVTAPTPNSGLTLARQSKFLQEVPSPVQPMHDQIYFHPMCSCRWEMDEDATLQGQPLSKFHRSVHDFVERSATDSADSKSRRFLNLALDHKWTIYL